MCFYVFNFVFKFFNFVKIDKLIFKNKMLTCMLMWMLMWYFLNIILIATSAFLVPTVPPFAISTFSISGLMAGIKIESIFFFFFRDYINSKINFGTKMRIDLKCRD